jgi:hypothetical protein
MNILKPYEHNVIEMIKERDNGNSNPTDFIIQSNEQLYDVKDEIVKIMTIQINSMIHEIKNLNDEMICEFKNHNDKMMDEIKCLRDEVKDLKKLQIVGNTFTNIHQYNKPDSFFSKEDLIDFINE